MTDDEDLHELAEMLSMEGAQILRELNAEIQPTMETATKALKEAAWLYRTNGYSAAQVAQHLASLGIVIALHTEDRYRSGYG